MSFKAIKVERNLTRTLLADTRSDIDTLPTNTTKGINGLTNTDNNTVAIGSRAICSEDWSKWILTPDNIWKQLPSGGNGGSDSSDTDFEIITDEEINDIIGGLS